ncbi:MAG: gliding motility-associated C-terminal domain-containing protein, partial [Hymenobacteraceae bacterium]|nr:gliding motility-associated C-terminal domain-containing protein [Hymenobacteraceae bacterium]MDX5395664.1 gliding motility-associated C-terminal domain-containing protein [Hymenobacteraceae bacterium]MDX5511717.1 gliding motility-associated C-terminal domain-containing protein [Hymenobacteraceae bacterium]
LKFYNIITPNNDKRNDCFFVENLQYYPNSSINVYNRWGQKVYSNNNYDNSFDGKNLSDGIYYYILTTLLGEQYKGWVELVR